MILSAFTEYGRSADYLVALAMNIFAYVIVYPGYIFYIRARNTTRIRRQLVTSVYKLPIALSPAELSYVFSTYVGKRQMHAVLYDLASRDVVAMREYEGTQHISIGPKVDSKLKPFEKLLVGQVHLAGHELPVDKVVEGFTNFVEHSGEKVSGSRSYVFWWLIRSSLRSQKLIITRVWTVYISDILRFALPASFLLSVVPLWFFRISQMITRGGIDTTILRSVLLNGLLFWLLAIPGLIVVAFFVLRFRGRMLGRVWILAPKFEHYLSQIDNYREFVRLLHKGSLRFSSEEIKKESFASTKPFAIALGYAPINR